MITSLRMRNFKNFRDAELKLGPLTVLIGANASGKSNIRDAFRFLHGNARGYNLAEIVGEKYGDGGEFLWRGIRGGIREIAFHGESDLTLGFSSMTPTPEGGGDVQDMRYDLKVGIQGIERPPVVMEEGLWSDGFLVLRARPEPDSGTLKVEIDPEMKSGAGGEIPLDDHWSALGQMTQLHLGDPLSPTVRSALIKAVAECNTMRFFDLSPSAMRMASFPGQDVLGDRGENLSSVLMAICRDESSKQTLVEWIDGLTPMEVKDFRFVPDQAGRFLVSFVEADGRETSAYSASDGTLRFLAMLAAILSPEPARFYFIEEIDNGIHPTRLSMLIELIERIATGRRIQIVATTHSPYLLGHLSRDSLHDASLIYRTEGRPDARILRLGEIPHAMEIIEKQGAARLHASGWFEDIVEFMEDEAEV